MREAASDSASPSGPASKLSPGTAGFLAWLVPGLGHFLLGRRRRGLAFFGLIVFALVAGAMLDGNLGTILAGPPLAVLRTLGCMGAGFPYVLLRFVVGYVGSADAAGFEYGSAFLVSGGLMNMMLVLDAHDIAAGRKE